MEGLREYISGASATTSPAEVAPERALVFAVIGAVADFADAARNVGLEWLAEDIASTPGGDDDDSEYTDDEAEAETPLYVTMPTMAGLQRLLAMWNRYCRGEGAEGQEKVWWRLFGYLSDIRPWSVKDRIDPAVGAFITRSFEREPNKPIRLELDLWYRANRDLRERAYSYLSALMDLVGGELLDFATIEEIQYQAALVEIPKHQAKLLLQGEGAIATADPVMRVRPQSLYSADAWEPAEYEAPAAAPGELDERPTIAALLDGYPVQNHALLRNRVNIEEVEIAGVDVPVSRRFHGTAMASLIIHGDLSLGESPIERAITVVPILGAPQNLNYECTPPDKLPLAMVYRAVKALVEGNQSEGQEPLAPQTVIINHSVCDQEAPFVRRPSPWAKLLDFLSHKYSLLFIVSAGNIREPFTLDDYKCCAELLAAPNEHREIVILRSLERSKGLRGILSPAEAVNVLTVGALHSDGAPPAASHHVDPFSVPGVTNLGSAIGLGVNRGVKPDLVHAGGRQMVGHETDGGEVSVWAREGAGVGQLVAAPDVGGNLFKQLTSTGTSNAAALVTRSAIRVADVLSDVFAQDGQDWVDEETRAVTLKALLAHSSRWGEAGRLLDGIYPPQQAERWARRREAITRFLGYGEIDLDRILTRDGSRVTLLADDTIGHDQRHEFQIPIPRAMVQNRELRRIVLTLAWSSPIEPATNRYRGFGLEVVDGDGKRKFWSGVKAVLQPHPDAGRRGTLQHLIFEGETLVRSAGRGAFSVCVQARATMKSCEELRVPYALAATLELAQPVRQDVFADVSERIRPKVAVAVRERTRTRVRSA